MNENLDELLRDFAQAQLRGQRRKLAASFKPVPRRGDWRWVITPLAVAAGFFLTAGMVLVEYPTAPEEATPAVAALDAPESVTDEVWYRDLPGQTVLLEDNTTAQVVYRQIYEIHTTVNEAGNEVVTETTPADLIALVGMPVY